MSEKIQSCDERDLGAFIPSALDDYGLNPYEFRVYSRLVRRAGRGQAWESVANMAKACQMCDRKVRDAIALLLKTRMIEGNERPGQTTVYVLMPQSKWMPPEEIDQLRKEALDYKTKGVGTTYQGTLVPHTKGVGTTYQGTLVPHTKGVGTTYQGTLVPHTNEGTPSEGIPSKAFPEKEEESFFLQEGKLLELGSNQEHETIQGYLDSTKYQEDVLLVEISSDRKEEERVPPAADFPDLSIRPRDWNSSMPWLAADINEFTSKIEFNELRQFKNWLPGWRSGWNIVGIKPDFLEYIQNTYLPTTPDYRRPDASPPTIQNARSWVSKRDCDVALYGLVFNLYQQFQCAQAAKKEAELRFAIASSESLISPPVEAQEDEWKPTSDDFNDLRQRLGLPLKPKEAA